MDFPWVWRLRPPGHPAFRNRISQSLLSDCDINFLQGKFFFILLFVWLSQKLLRTKCWLLNAKFDRCSIRTHAHTRVQKGHRKIFWIWRLRPLRHRALSSSITQLLRYLFDNTFSYCKICFVFLFISLTQKLLPFEYWFYEHNYWQEWDSNPRTRFCAGCLKLDFAWVWRLRPLGHPAFKNRISQLLQSVFDKNFSYCKIWLAAPPLVLTNSASNKRLAFRTQILTGEGFEPRHTFVPEV